MKLLYPGQVVRDKAWIRKGGGGSYEEGWGDGEIHWNLIYNPFSWRWKGFVLHIYEHHKAIPLSEWKCCHGNQLWMCEVLQNRCCYSYDGETVARQSRNENSMLSRHYTWHSRVAILNGFIQADTGGISNVLLYTTGQLEEAGGWIQWSGRDEYQVIVSS